MLRKKKCICTWFVFMNSRSYWNHKHIFLYVYGIQNKCDAYSNLTLHLSSKCANMLFHYCTCLHYCSIWIPCANTNLFSLQSSYHMRVARCSEIFEAAKTTNPSLSKFIADSTKLADKFLELSNKPVEKVRKKTYYSLFKEVANHTYLVKNLEKKCIQNIRGITTFYFSDCFGLSSPSLSYFWES